MRGHATRAEKYFYRRRRWGRPIVAGLLCLLISSSFGWPTGRPEIGPDLQLREGDYVVRGVLDPITLTCERVLSPDSSETPERIHVRLLGVELLPNQSGVGSAAMDCTLRFLRDCPNRVVRLQFDRYRFDKQRVPLAYVLNGGRQLNQEILDSGAAAPTSIPGRRVDASNPR